MAGENCSLTCNVKIPGTDKVKVSALWEDLTKFFKGNRRDAVVHYFLTKDSNFLMQNSDVLEFDADGEVTISSLKKAMERGGEYSNLSNFRTLEHLNRELKAGEYSYSEALDNVLKFNKSNQFREGFMATLKPESNGKYSIRVVERNSNSEYELADHVFNKLMTDAIRISLKNHGLSVEFLDNPSYAATYSTNNAHFDGDGLMAVAQIMDGISTSKEAAEVAGHFIVAAMQDNPLVQRLIEQLTPAEVQEELFRNNDRSEMFRDDFIVSEDSAREAAGILIGKALLNPFEKAQKGNWYSAANLGASIPKGIKFLVSKIVNAAKRILGIYKPDVVKRIAQEAKAMASTAAEGYLSNPESVDVDTALNNPITYTSMGASKQLSEDVKRNVRAYYDTLGSLKDVVSRLRTSIGRTENPLNRDIYKKIKQLTKRVSTSYNERMGMETLADQASIEGMVIMLEGITQILDTDVRALLESIQPSDRVSSKISIVNNARNMTTVSNTVKSIAELQKMLSNKLDTLRAGDNAIFNDEDGNMVSESLRDAVKRLEDVLIGREEEYVDPKGVVQEVNGLARLMELKRRQVYLDAMKDFYGSDYIEVNAGKLWEQVGNTMFRKLVTTGDRKIAIQDLIDSLQNDISLFDRYISSASDCGDFVTAVSAKVIKASNMWADRISSRFWDQVEELRLQMQDAFGTTDCTMFYEVMDVQTKSIDEKTGEEKTETHEEKTGNLVAEVNHGAWERDREEFKKELRKGFNDHITELRKKAYANNKGDTGFVFRLTDEQRGILWHAYIEPLWEKWHAEHSQKDTSIPGKVRWIPNATKYHSKQWDNLFDSKAPGLSDAEKAERIKRLKWYNALMSLKEEMDGLLAENATVKWRAPQMVGRFSHRFKNIKTQMNNSKAAFGHALRSKAQDFAIIREDEAWMFGSNNDFNELSEDPMENPLYFEKEKINRLPVWGVNKLKDMNLLSTDLFGTLLEYGSMASNYKAMEQVVDIFELGRDVLKQRKLGYKSEEKLDDGSTRAFTRYVKFAEKNLYGINVAAPSWDRTGMWRKLANTLSSIGSSILLWGNFHGGIVNTGTGVFEILKEAMTGENFTLSEAHQAHKMYSDGLMETVLNGFTNIQRPQDKNSLWIRHWNILSENKSFYRNQKYDTKAMSLLDNRLWDWFGHTMMLPYSSGDHYMQTIPYYAMGIHQKVYDRNGNKMNLIDAYEIVDGKEVFAIDYQLGEKSDALGRTPKKLKLKEGIFRSPADIDTFETTQSLLNKISDFFEGHPNAKGNDPLALNLFTDEERAFLLDEDLAVPANIKQLENLKSALSSKARNLTFNEDDEAAFMDKCRNICNRLHGIYNTEDKVAFQQNFYGSLVMSMRGYALGMANRRFADSRFNVPQNKQVEGSYNTAFKVAMSGFYDIYNMDNWKAVGEAFMLAAIPGALLFNKRFGDMMKADMKKAGFSEHQYYNMRRCGADFLVIEAIFLMKLLSSPGAHFGLNDEEDEDKQKGTTNSSNWLAGLIYYFMMRWDREQRAFNTIGGIKNEATSLLDYVPVGFSGADNIWSIGELFAKTQLDKLDGEPDKENSELYYQSSKENKYEKGDAKWWIKFKRQIPYYRSWYTLTHPYDAASGYQYGRRVRSK